MKYFLIASLVSLFTLSVTAQTAQMNPEFATISLSTDAKQEVTPDEMVIQINVREWDKDFGGVTKKMEEQLRLAKEVITRAGVSGEEIKTTNLNVYKSYEYKNGKSQENGFNASSGLSLEIPLDFDLLNELMTDFAEASPNFSVSHRFQLSEDKEESVKDELIVKALQKARAKAETMANALGKKAVDIWRMEYSETGRPIMPYMRSMAMEANALHADQSTEKGMVEQVKDIEIGINVQTVWQLNAARMQND